MAHKYFAKAAILFAFIIIGSNALEAQEQESPVQKMMKDKQYIFKAQSYSSSSVPARTLTIDYDLKIKPDSVIAFLPYFGQSYTAQINQTDGGIKFRSARFDYSGDEKKKGKWQVTIRPKDVRDVSQLFMTVFPDGSAMLQVMSSGREAMTFNGYVTNN
jgi:hypothetical protein